MANILEQFAELFAGGDQAYGQWDQSRGKGFTKHGAPTLAQYQAHIEGKIGLGLVPVRTNGTCRFAAIDIDVDTIDHAQLYRSVSERRFPLTVCRSKSGGAHLYLFTKGPGLPAGAIRDVLKRWSTILGYPSAEIFPKQSAVGQENIGNWINLPYFGGDSTTRYAVGADGVKTLEEFLATVELYSAETVNVDESTRKEVAKMPPCLAALSQHGVQEGGRNNALFNFAVFYRKSQPANWETAVNTLNSQFFSPPLEYREVQGVVNSAGRTKYQYLCETSPLREHCDRQACLQLPYGINHMPWEERGTFDDFVVTHCRKLLTDPPRYIVEVNGHDIVMEWEQLYNYRNFKSRVGEQMNIVVPNLKQPQWESRLRDLLAKREEIEAPEDASLEGLVLDRFHEFLGLRERATNREDLLRGIPILEGDVVLFRMGDFRRYLQGYKLDRIEGSQLFVALRRDGCSHKRVRISGRLTLVWAYPADKVNSQTSEYAVPNFKKDLGEEM